MKKAAESEKLNAANESTSVENNSGTTLNFQTKWDMSDVAIKTHDSDNILYVNKSVLAVHSPFFKALFFSQFAESMQDVVDVGIDFSVMLEILKIIHHVNRNYGLTGHQLYSSNTLASLYRAGDQFDIPIIRELCKQQFVQIAPKDAFELAIELELHEEKSQILKKMSYKEIESYLNKGISALVLSPVDAAVIVEKCKEHEKDLPRCTGCGRTDRVTPNKTYAVFLLSFMSARFQEQEEEEDSAATQNMSLQKDCADSIDFTKKWEMSDVAIKTHDSDNILYVNKSVLAVHSPFFKALFFSQFAESMQDVVDVGIDFSVMLEILKIIHHVNRNYGLTGHQLYSSNTLASLYRAGDQFDIPIIRELCKQQFVQIAPKDAFELAIELELHEEKSQILKKMSFEEIESYLNKGISALVLSPVDAAVIVQKCQERDLPSIRYTSQVVDPPLDMWIVPRGGSKCHRYVI